MTSHHGKVLDDDDPQPRKLNVFALPNQTTIMATIIILVVYATIIGISLDTIPMPLWPFLIGLLILSIRSWLTWPEQEAQAHQFLPAGNHVQRLQSCIMQLSERVRIKRLPRAMIARKDDVLFVYGGWRRWFIGIGPEKAATMDALLDNRDAQPYVEAALLHELHHFKLGDHRLIAYTRALLRTGRWFIGWASLFVVGLLVIIWSIIDDFLKHPPAEIAARFEAVLPGLGLGDLMLAGLPAHAERLAMQQLAPTINFRSIALYVLGNTFTILLISTILVVFFWSKLSRFRELYADAGVVQIQGTSAYLMGVTSIISATKQFYGEPETTQSLWQRILGKLRRSQTFLPSIAILRRWLSHEPDSRHRVACIEDPRQLFDTWQGSTVLIGLFVFVLEQLMGNTATVFYLGTWPMHFAILAIFVLISLVSIVGVVLDRPAWHEALKIIGVIIGVRAAMIFMMLGSWSILDTEVMTSFFNFTYLLTLGSGRFDSPVTPADVEGIWLQAIVTNLTQILVTCGLVIGATWLQLQITQRTLKWYSFPGASKRLMRTIYASILLIALILAFGILPVITNIVLWRFDQVLSPMLWLLMAGMLTLGCIAAIWFYHQDRRYRGHCSNCDTVVPGEYTFGRRCCHCGVWLHEWLYTDYQTEFDE